MADSSECKIVDIGEPAIKRLSISINKIVQAAHLELPMLSREDKIDIGKLIAQASKLAYFNGVNLPLLLSVGHAPTVASLNEFVRLYEMNK